MLLISIALLLLAVGLVTVGLFYWSGLRGGVQQMHASMDEASRRQQVLTQQVSEAQAALEARQVELDRLQAQLGERAGAARKAPAVEAMRPPPPGLGSPRPPLSAAQWARLRVRLDAISRSVSRLAPPRPSQRPPLQVRPERDALLHGGRALRAQLQVAESALALADPVLLGTAAAAAQRLLLDLYGGRADAQVLALDRQLGALRAELSAAGEGPR